MGREPGASGTIDVGKVIQSTTVVWLNQTKLKGPGTPHPPDETLVVIIATLCL